VRPNRLKLLLLLSFFSLLSCLGWFLENPTFLLKEISLTRLSPQEVHLQFGIEVQNPNRFDLKLRSLEYVAVLNDREVGQGRIQTEVTIPQFASSLVHVPLQADLQKLGPILAAVLTGAPLKYQVTGSAVVKAALGTATLPFSKSGEIKIKRKNPS
jgi:LEA14-like dessication related protein